MQLAAHVVLNLQSVNLQLVAHESPTVSEAAIERLRDSGDRASLPTLQQEFVEEIERDGLLTRDTLLGALTQLGGAKGWQDLLDSGRLGVTGDDARTWRFVINNVREMTNPPYADASPTNGPHGQNQTRPHVAPDRYMELVRARCEISQAGPVAGQPQPSSARQT